MPETSKGDTPSTAYSEISNTEEENMTDQNIQEVQGQLAEDITTRMQRLILQRAGIRSSFTKTYNKFKAEIQR